MKNLRYIFILLPLFTFGQVIDFYPPEGSGYNSDSTIITLPEARTSFEYSEIISLHASENILIDVDGVSYSLPFKSAFITDISTPDGITYECNEGYCLFEANKWGEIRLFGTPAIVGDYSVVISSVVTVDATPLGLPAIITFPIPYDGSNLLLNLIIDNDYSYINEIVPTFVITVGSNIVGCLDSIADNYNELADESDDSCEYSGCPYPNFIEFNPDYTTADVSMCLTFIVNGCTDVVAENYNPEATLNDTSCIYNGCMDELADNYNEQANQDDASCIYYGCMNYTAVNYDPSANTENESCIIYGCTLETFPNYNSEATEDNLSCDMNSINVYGCMNIDYIEYDSLANLENGSCMLLVVYGCTDELACNFSSVATNNDGTCIYVNLYYDCNGDCVNDLDADGVCDELEVEGCMDEIACNFDAEATEMDGSCIYQEVYYNCNGDCINDIDADGVCDEEDYDDEIGVDELVNKSNKLIKMIDILGREQKVHLKGMLLFYVYENGKVEKRLLN